MNVSSTAHESPIRQTITNEREIPALELQRPLNDLPVRARIDWLHDGTEYINTVATDWYDGIILVQIFDRRYPTHGVWLDLNDVERI